MTEEIDLLKNEVASTVDSKDMIPHAQVTHVFAALSCLNHGILGKASRGAAILQTMKPELLVARIPSTLADASFEVNARKPETKFNSASNNVAIHGLDDWPSNA